MMWPERAALGLWAILSIALVGLYANGLLNAVAPAERLENYVWRSSSVPIGKEPPSAAPPTSGDFLTDLQNAQRKDEIDAEVGIIPDRKADVGDLLSLIVRKVGLFCALPVWLILRIVDFVFGGPARRRRLSS